MPSRGKVRRVFDRKLGIKSIHGRMLFIGFLRNCKQGVAILRGLGSAGMKSAPPCALFNASFVRLTPAETSVTYSVPGINAGTIVVSRDS